MWVGDGISPVHCVREYIGDSPLVSGSLCERSNVAVRLCVWMSTSQQLAGHVEWVSSTSPSTSFLTPLRVFVRLPRLLTLFLI